MTANRTHSNKANNASHANGFITIAMVKDSCSLVTVKF